MSLVLSAINLYSCFLQEENMQVAHLLSRLDTKTYAKEFDGTFSIVSFFSGTNQRKIVQSLQTKATSHSREIFVSQE